LLGREFLVTHQLLYRLWDYMFACCYDIETNGKQPNSSHLDHDEDDDDTPPNVYSLLANVRAFGYNKSSNQGKRGNSGDNSRAVYVCTPLLAALGDLMLAMLIQVIITVLS
jgi:hypothetical protein